MSRLRRVGGWSRAGILAGLGLLWCAGAVAVQEDEDPVRAELESIVRTLSLSIGPRSYQDPEGLAAAAEFIEKRLAVAGYRTESQPYRAGALHARNVIGERRGASQPDRVIVVGAHYDTVAGSPGADDNASGVAVLLELARMTAHTRSAKTVRFVAFTLEEPPFFRTAHMGSRVYAGELRVRGERVDAMLCLESVGYYSDDPGSQSFPLLVFWLRWRYPTIGNFITIVGNSDSQPLQKDVHESLKTRTGLAVETYTGPWWVPGVDWSDHRSFWNEGYPAVMLTDTALFRNPHYHGPSDLPDTLNYRSMAELARGLSHTLTELDSRP